MSSEISNDARHSQMELSESLGLLLTAPSSQLYHTGNDNLTFRSDSDRINMFSNLFLYGNFRVSGNTIIEGNLLILGNSTIVNTDIVRIEDPLLYLGNDFLDGEVPGRDIGIIGNRGSQDAFAAFWNESENRFVIATAPNIAYDTNTISDVGLTPVPFRSGNIEVGNASSTAEIKASGNYNLDITSGNSGTSQSKITLEQGSSGDIFLAPALTGKIIVGTGTSDATIKSERTSGTPNLILETSNSTTGQIKISSTDISLIPHTSSSILVGSGSNSNATIKADGTNNLVLDATSTSSGKITVPGSTGSGFTLGTVEVSADQLIVDKSTGSIISSKGDQNMTLQTGSTTSSKISINNGASGDILVGSGSAAAKISSSGNYNLELYSAKGSGTSTNISLVPSSTGKIYVGNTSNSTIIQKNDDNNELHIVSGATSTEKAKISLNQNTPSGDNYNIRLLADKSIRLQASSNVNINSNLYISTQHNRVGVAIAQKTPDVTLEIGGTDAVKIPKGTTVERPTASSSEHNGYIRYNTTTSQFEGFGAGNAWGSLGGVIDVDQDTYIKAESTAGVDNDQIQFYTSGNERMRIENDGNVSITHNLEVTGDIILKSQRNELRFHSADVSNPNSYVAIRGCEVVTGSLPIVWTLPKTMGSNGQVLTRLGSNTDGNLSWTNIISGSMSNIIEDSSPQLGADLDVVTHSIVTTSNRDIQLNPNGSGKVTVGGVEVVTVSGTQTLSDKTFTSLKSSGNVGIKSTNPTHELEVIGCGYISQNLTVGTNLTVRHNLVVLGNIESGDISGRQITSTIPTGTAPFVVTSTTEVANLKAATATTATTATTVTNATQSAITSVGTLTSLTTSGDVTLGGHLIPSSNAIYDIGSADKKVRDLYVSDSSIWVGDTHKLTISDGKMKFRKRKIDTVPAAITSAGGNDTGAKSHASVSNISDITIDKWLSYMRTLGGQSNATIQDIFRDDDDDYSENVESGALNITENTTTNSNLPIMFSNRIISGEIKPYMSSDLTFNPLLQELRLNANMTILGNLTITGNRTVINSDVVNVSDQIIILGNNSSGAPLMDSGIILKRGSSSNATLYWDETSDRFTTALTTDSGQATTITRTGYADVAVKELYAGTTKAIDTNGRAAVAAQTNITSLGTLTGLTVSGEVSMTTLDIGGTDVTSTATELNFVDGSGAGTIVPSKAVVYGSGGQVNATILQIGGTSISSTAAELNYLDTSSAGTIVPSKAVVYGSSGEVNATTLQIGGTSITSTAAELNYLDTSSAGTIVNSKAVVYGSSGEVNATTLQIGGTSITSTAAELNYLDITTLGTTQSSKALTANSSGHVLMPSGKEIRFNDTNESVYGDGSNLIIKSGGTAFKIPTADGSSNQVLKTDGDGTLSWISTGGSDISLDTSPQLGGNLVVGSHLITNTGTTPIKLSADVQFNMYNNREIGTASLTFDETFSGGFAFNHAVYANPDFEDTLTVKKTHEKVIQGGLMFNKSVNAYIISDDSELLDGQMRHERAIQAGLPFERSVNAYAHQDYTDLTTRMNYNDIVTGGLRFNKSVQGYGYNQTAMDNNIDTRYGRMNHDRAIQAGMMFDGSYETYANYDKPSYSLTQMNITSPNSVQTITVPSNCFRVYFELYGAAGGDGGDNTSSGNSGGSGANGSKVAVIYNVIPTQQYSLYIGTAGGNGTNSSGNLDGGSAGTISGSSGGGGSGANGGSSWLGSGYGGGGGGGGGTATYITLQGSSTKLIAGGGGGGGGGGTSSNVGGNGYAPNASTQPFNTNGQSATNAASSSAHGGGGGGGGGVSGWGGGGNKGNTNSSGTDRGGSGGLSYYTYPGTELISFETLNSAANTNGFIKYEFLLAPSGITIENVNHNIAIMSNMYLKFEGVADSKQHEIVKIPSGTTSISGQKQKYTVTPTNVSSYNDAKYGIVSTPVVATLWNNKAFANSTQTWQTIKTKEIVHFAGDAGFKFILFNDGTLKSCGMNEYGQLGINSVTNTDTFVDVFDIDTSNNVVSTPITNVKKVSCGYFHTLIIMNDGTVRSCGRDLGNRIARPVSSNDNRYFKPIPNLFGVMDISAGDANSYFLLEDGTVKKNDVSVGADGFVNDSVTFTERVISISAGYQHIIYLLADGTVSAAGPTNTIADGTVMKYETPLEILTDVIKISAGYWTGMLLMNDGTIRTCGAGAGSLNGQAHKNAYIVKYYKNNTVTLTPPETVTDVVDIANRGHASYALLKNGKILCWGLNSQGQLGDNSQSDRAFGNLDKVTSFVQYSGSTYIDDAISMHGSGNNFYFITTESKIYSLGYNASGQLGINISTITGPNSLREEPVAVHTSSSDTSQMTAKNPMSYFKNDDAYSNKIIVFPNNGRDTTSIISYHNNQIQATLSANIQVISNIQGGTDLYGHNMYGLRDKSVNIQIYPSTATDKDDRTFWDQIHFPNGLSNNGKTLSQLSVGTYIYANNNKNTQAIEIPVNSINISSNIVTIGSNMSFANAQIMSNIDSVSEVYDYSSETPNIINTINGFTFHRFNGSNYFSITAPDSGTTQENITRDSSNNLYTSYTLECWVKLSTTVSPTGGVHYIAMSHRDGLNSGYVFGIQHTGTDSDTGYIMVYGPSNGGYQGIGGLTQLTRGVWYHIAVTQYHTSSSSVNNIKFYLDGILESTHNKANHNLSITDVFRIGTSDGTHYFTGDIRDVRFWGGVILDESTINIWKNSLDLSNHPNIANLEVQFKMNEGSGTSISDSSSNNFTGTLQSGGENWIVDPVILGNYDRIRFYDGYNTSTTTGDYNKKYIKVEGVNGSTPSQIIQLPSSASSTSGTPALHYTYTLSDTYKLPDVEQYSSTKYGGSSNTSNPIFTIWDTQADATNTSTWNKIRLDGFANIPELPYAVSDLLVFAGNKPSYYEIKSIDTKGNVIINSNINILPNIAGGITTHEDEVTYGVDQSSSAIQIYQGKRGSSDTEYKNADNRTFWDELYLVSVSPTASSLQANYYIYGNPTDNILNFDGSDDYVQINTDPSLINTDEFTVEGWVKISSYSSSTYHTLISNIDMFISNGENGYVIYLYINGTNTEFRIKTYSAGNVTSYDGGTTPIISLNTWTHFALTRDGSNRIRLYVDNVLKSGPSVGNYTKNTRSAYKIRYGRQINNDYPFNGQLRNIRIWSKELSINTINEWKNIDTPLIGHPNYSNLKLHHPLNEGTPGTPATTVKDISSNSYDGAIYNGGSLGASWTTGKNIIDSEIQLTSGNDTTNKITLKTNNYITYENRDIFGNISTNVNTYYYPTQGTDPDTAPITKIRITDDTTEYNHLNMYSNMYVKFEGVSGSTSTQFALIPTATATQSGNNYTYTISSLPSTGSSSLDDTKYGTLSTPVITTVWNSKPRAETLLTWKTLETKKSVQLVGGDQYMMILFDDGTLKSCGLNNVGQLGINTLNTNSSHADYKRTTFVDVLDYENTSIPITNVKKVSSSNGHSLILMNDGTVRSCGSNTSNQLGRTVTGTDNALFKPISSGLSGVIDISAGNTHSIFLLKNGKVKVCGTNTYGVMGVGTSSTPTDGPDFAERVISISSAFQHSLFLLASGEVMVCGRNNKLQAGSDSSFSEITTPINIETSSDVKLTNVVKIMAGYYNNIFLMNDGTIRTSGTGEGATPANSANIGQDQYAREIIDQSTSPLSALTNVVDIYIGASQGAYALLKNGKIVSWGLNNHGMLGNNTSGNNNHRKYNAINSTSTLVKNASGSTYVTDALVIGAGGHKLFFATQEGKIYSVGKNNVGQLGIKSTAEQHLPIAVHTSSTNSSQMTSKSYMSYFTSLDASGSKLVIFPNDGRDTTNAISYQNSQIHATLNTDIEIMPNIQGGADLYGHKMYGLRDKPVNIQIYPSSATNKDNRTFWNELYLSSGMSRNGITIGNLTAGTYIYGNDNTNSIQAEKTIETTSSSRNVITIASNISYANALVFGNLDTKQQLYQSSVQGKTSHSYAVRISDVTTERKNEYIKFEGITGSTSNVIIQMQSNTYYNTSSVVYPLASTPSELDLTTKYGTSSSNVIATIWGSETTATDTNTTSWNKIKRTAGSISNSDANKLLVFSGNCETAYTISSVSGDTITLSSGVPKLANLTGGTDTYIKDSTYGLEGAPSNMQIYPSGGSNATAYSNTINRTFWNELVYSTLSAAVNKTDSNDAFTIGTGDHQYIRYPDGPSESLNAGISYQVGSYNLKKITLNSNHTYANNNLGVYGDGSTTKIATLHSNSTSAGRNPFTNLIVSSSLASDPQITDRVVKYEGLSSSATATTKANTIVPINEWGTVNTVVVGSENQKTGNYDTGKIVIMYGKKTTSSGRVTRWKAYFNTVNITSYVTPLIFQMVGSGTSTKYTLKGVGTSRKKTNGTAGWEEFDFGLQIGSDAIESGYTLGFAPYNLEWNKNQSKYHTIVSNTSPISHDTAATNYEFTFATFTGWNSASHGSDGRIGMIIGGSAVSPSPHVSLTGNPPTITREYSFKFTYETNATVKLSQQLTLPTVGSEYRSKYGSNSNSRPIITIWENTAIAENSLTWRDIKYPGTVSSSFVNKTLEFGTGLTAFNREIISSVNTTYSTLRLSGNISQTTALKEYGTSKTPINILVYPSARTADGNFGRWDVMVSSGTAFVTLSIGERFYIPNVSEPGVIGVKVSSSNVEMSSSLTPAYDGRYGLIGSEITINGEAINTILPEINGSQDFGSATKRWKTIYATNALNTSDKTLKKNIEDCNIDIEFINDLKPVSFQWNTDSSNVRNYGLIAQDVKETMTKYGLENKECGFYNDPKDENKEGTLGLSYTQFVPLLIKSVQTLNTQLQESKSENDNLKDLIKDLSNRLDKLEEK